MLKTNDREWKEFFIKDIFITKETYRGIQMPTGAHIEKEKLYNGKIPRITVTSRNNGVDSFCYTEDRNKREYSNFISVSFLGSAFYQKGSATLDMKVHALIPKDIDLNQYIALFIIVALLNNIKNSTYGNQLSSTDLPRRKILLPVNKESKPDYKFMEQFIKEREEVKRQEYINYCAERTSIGGGYIDSKKLIPSISLNDRNWKCFYISNENGDGIFDLRASLSGIDKNKLLSSELKNTPYVTRSDMNNGINSFVGDMQRPIYEKDAGNVITIGLDTQTVFYQPYGFYTGQNIQVLYNIYLNEYTAKFMIPLLKNQVSKLSWGGTGATLGRLRRMQFLLPVNAKNEPDYEFMENYIKEREFIKMQEYLDYCNCIMESY